MSLPANGKYLIRSSGGSLIGANKDNSDVKRVVTFGDMEQWSITNENGVYRFALEDNWVSTKADKNVVVRRGVASTRWELILAPAPGPSGWVIKSTDADTVWTSTVGYGHGFPVVLEAFRAASPWYQVWEFIPA